MIGKVPISRLSLWRVDDRTKALAERVPCSPLTALLLRMRGVSEQDVSEARAWLCPSLDDSLDGLALSPSSREAALLWKKMEGAERVVVYGDYDVDGACATTLALELALASFREVRYFIPHRHLEGYGVHENIVRDIARNGCDLLVAVDCGTRDIAALRAAREAGIRVIVFDHHAPGDSLPEGAVVVNPHAGGDDAARTLCGAGVLWAWARIEKIAPADWLADRTDLVALATLADHVPLGGLNRAIVTMGIGMIRLSKRRGLRSLLLETGSDPGSVDGETLLMKIIPCLNAAGRLGLADTAVDLLLGSADLAENTRELVRLNRKRQSISAEILETALPQVAGGVSLVLSDFSWPVGVLSGVASRICSESGLPVALASRSSDHVRGTLRVPAGVDALEVLGRLSDGLLSWGGHRFAAGFSVALKDWEGVRARMDSILRSLNPFPEAVTAIEVSPEELTEQEVRSMEEAGPFGSGNPAPLFFARRGGSLSFEPLGKDGRHVKVLNGGSEFCAFGGAPLIGCISDSHGWIYRTRINRWKGRSRVDMVIESIVTDDGSLLEGCDS
ncbi:MAG: DHH family phosphoesterase [Thermovirgaceae bacterium]|nr:DHH family phosphoesterase [Thermovirgaceae bacterium]